MSKNYLEDNSAQLDDWSNKLSQVFAHIDELKNKLSTVKHDDIQSIEELHRKFSKYHQLISKFHAQVKALKKNKQAAKYIDIRHKSSGKNEKFVSATAEEEASLFVAKERELTYMLEAYMNSCLETLRSCRTTLNMYQKINKVSYVKQEDE